MISHHHNTKFSGTSTSPRSITKTIPKEALKIALMIKKIDPKHKLADRIIRHANKEGASNTTSQKLEATSKAKNDTNDHYSERYRMVKDPNDLARFTKDDQRNRDTIPGTPDPRILKQIAADRSNMLKSLGEGEESFDDISAHNVLNALSAHLGKVDATGVINPKEVSGMISAISTSKKRVSRAHSTKTAGKKGQKAQSTAQNSQAHSTTNTSTNTGYDDDDFDDDDLSEEQIHDIDIDFDDLSEVSQISEATGENSSIHSSSISSTVKPPINKKDQDQATGSQLHRPAGPLNPQQNRPLEPSSPDVVHERTLQGESLQQSHDETLSYALIHAAPHHSHTEWWQAALAELIKRSEEKKAAREEKQREDDEGRMDWCLDTLIRSGKYHLVLDIIATLSTLREHVPPKGLRKVITDHYINANKLLDRVTPKISDEEKDHLCAPEQLQSWRELMQTIAPRLGNSVELGAADQAS